MSDTSPALNPIIAKLRFITEHPMFERSILSLIIFNAIILGMETSDTIMASVLGPILLKLDAIILMVFVVEVVLRLIADFKGFWKNPWRIFDLISQVRSMRRVVTGLLSALPGMGSIVLLLSLIFYVFAVISTKLFKDAFPEWFGTIGESSYTLFQIMTLESWSMGIVRPVMEQYPYSWLLFVPFIVMTAFTVLNLFIGVIVDAMQHEHELEAREERESLISDNELILSELRALRHEVRDLKNEPK